MNLTAALCLSALCLTATVAWPQPRLLVGAIRWDAWHGEASNVGVVVERTLGPERYHFRAPWFTEVLSPEKVRIAGNTQAIMDQEIAFAHDAGLDYWAFVTYPEDIPMSQSLALYLSSEHRTDMRFCLNLQGGWEGNGGAAGWPAKVARYLRYFTDPCYQTVLGDRPLVFLFMGNDLLGEGRFADWQQARQAVDDLRRAAREAGCGDPYLVIQDFSPAAAVETLQHLGADAISAYAIVGGCDNSPYADLARFTECWWEEARDTGLPVVPLAMSGWDRRPRIERPHPWEPWQKPGEGMNRYYETATPAELAQHVGNAVQWVSNNRAAAPAQAVLIYAWNENDEGGWLVPTLGDANARLEALKPILQPVEPPDLP